MDISLSSSFNICFGCSKEPSHWDGSFEYPQHMFWLRNKKINFWIHALKKNKYEQPRPDLTSYQSSDIAN